MDSLKHLETEGSPEKNAVNVFEKFFRAVGWVTHKSRTRNRYARPLSLKRERAQVLEKVWAETDKENRKELIGQARQKDEILTQFLNQQEIRVEVSETGEQMARFAWIKPKEGEEKPGEPPIFLIPGAANDLSCVETLAWELALEGRMVVVVGYPDSIMGEVSEEFANKVEKSQNYEAHAEFFAKALDQLIPDGEVEMWGFSTGAPIVAQMLSNPELSKRVGKAVLMAPASSVDQTNSSFVAGLVAEVGQLLLDYKNIPKYTWTTGRKNEDLNHKKRREKSLKYLFKKVQTGMSNLWENARVKEGGVIQVVSGRDDRVTKSRDYFGEFESKNPQLRVIEIEGGHAAALLDPERVLSQIARSLVSRWNLPFEGE